MTKSEIGSHLFNYLNIRSALKKADLIIGFGHFDKKIPLSCIELYNEGYADKILFTGGCGSGTADIDTTEADYFNSFAVKSGITGAMIENQSTNTSENILCSIELLKKYNLEFNKDIKSVILVANAYRQRRVDATFKKLVPKINIINYPPITAYESEIEMFDNKNENLL